MTPTAAKPGPSARREHWFQPRRSGFRWEQEGLEHVRQLMPNAEPYRAWATFRFTGVTGRVNECDLLIAVPGGVYLLELKGHPGRVVNHGDTWQFHGDRVRTLRNPLHLTDLKAKELKAQLERAAHAAGIPEAKIPFIKPAVFLHDPDLVSELDEFQRASVYGRNGGTSGLPGIWEGLLGLPPERDSRRVTPQDSQRLEMLMKRIGISHSTSHLRFGDDWRLAPRALDAGPGWEDRLAVRDDGLVKESGRVRIYLSGQAASSEQRGRVDRAALREYQVLQGINHRGIVQAVQIREHQGGPAILFRHQESDLRLDAYLDAYGDRLTPPVRLDLVRQLADAVRYAHDRSLYHRALSARSVYVSAREDGTEPVLRIADWQTAARDFDTTSHLSLGQTPLDSGLVADIAQVYLAPEAAREFADPVDLDVFGIGAVSYLLLTGKPPADVRGALVDRLAAEGGLRPSAASDSVSAALDDLIFRATASDVQNRTSSADEFLRQLDTAEADDAAARRGAVEVADPLSAKAGCRLDAEWEVVRVLGTGATARALLVRRVEDGVPDPSSLRVFKVALDREKDARLHAEAKALREVGGNRIVKLLAPPRELGGHTVLEIEYAGGFRPADDREAVSLGSRLRGEGRLGYAQLERFGNDLFEALDSLAARGVRHRDIKPDNLGLFKRSDGSWQLMLFDFSLADASDQDLHAGTRGYLDPFLGGSRRARFDDHAEWYAAAVTLHEMASGERPVWGDGQGDPLTVPEAELYVARELFDPALAEGLTEFFGKALHRDVEQRFDSLRQLQEAWRQVFRRADSTRPPTTPATVDTQAADVEDAREQAAAAAGLATPLHAAGLSPRAVSVAAGLGAETVGRLLDIPPHTISRARGAGNVIRKELNRRHRQWTQQLRKRATAKQPVRVAADASVEPLESVGTLAARLVPTEGGPRTRPRRDIVLATLGLPGVAEAADLPPWPAQSAIAKALGVSQPTVSGNLSAAIELWAALPWLETIRDELVTILSEQGRVMTAQELATELRVRYRPHDEDGEEDRAGLQTQALAVVRAAAEIEARRDDAAAAGGDEDGASRFAVLRRGSTVLLALVDLPGSDDPTPVELAEYATLLGRAAEEVAARDPLPGGGAALRELRAVPAPEGMTPLADTRLLTLAAAMAGGIGVTPRFELFPLDLGLDRALRISQAAAGVRPGIGIGADDLLSRVGSRFPGLATLAGVTYVEWEEALAEAHFPLEYDRDRRRFFPLARDVEQSRPAFTGSVLTSTGALYDAAQGQLAEGRDPRRVMEVRLQDAVRRGGFLALTVRGAQLPGTAERLAARLGVLPVDVDELFLAALRTLADEQQVRWGALLKADAKFAGTGRIGPALASYTRLAAERVAARCTTLAEQAGPRTVLLAHRASLVARYWEAGGRELLVSLQEAARRPASVPHGLWLLVPMDDPQATPALDGRTVDVVDRMSEWVVLEGLFMKELEGLLEAG
ncbi:BREX system serine/threonine kinase PglW [Streptomyces sp. A144]|uniref:BREX system serine/threonine kinase PglW n=1 Tax=Streptomyces sp. A144 TaxID=2871487 RepID=UPI001CC181F9|nr:BREX system serine/threonine kinase PglW [Streptomyces sp. A144]UAX55689.1 BREX system serine/threonine kinase PglW [Streptomyces sp. A144]